jgi:hypothetical protein
MRATLTIAIVLGALAVDRLALSTSLGATLLTPSPERTAQVFVTSVAAHRPEQARDRLTPAARERWSAARLRDLDRAWRERDGDYRMADGEASGGDERVELRAHFKTARRGAVERRFVLEREADTALWKVARVGDD